MEPTKTKQKRRSRFARVDEDHVLEIVPRDIDIFRHIARHRFLRSDHITALLAPASSKKIIERLGKLFHAGYVDRPKRQLRYYELGKPLVYAIGERAGVILQAAHYYRPGRVEWERRNQNAGQEFIEHTLLVADILVSIELSCRDKGWIFIPADEILSGAAEDVKKSRRNPWYWQIVADEGLGPRKMGVIPDGIFGLRNPTTNKSAFFFLEADTGTMTINRSKKDGRQNSVRAKFAAYLATALAGEHKTRFNVNNFRLITVTTNGKRLEALRAACADVTLGRMPAMFLFGLHPDVIYPSPLEYIFTKADGVTTTLAG